MKQKNISNLILTALVLVALAVGVILVKQSQELRRGAAFSRVDLNLWPTADLETKVGEDLNVYLKFQAKDNKVVDGIQTAFCHDGQLELDKSMGVSGVDIDEAIFDETPMVFEYDSGSKKCVLIVVTATKPATGLKNSAEIGKVYFKGKTEGQGSFTIDKSRSMVTGENSGSMDKELEIALADGTSYKVLPATVDPTGDGPILNYKVAFAGVKKDNKCANNMKAKLIVKSGEESKTYSTVELTRTAEVTAKGDSIYKGSKVLSTFTAKSAVAAFFKGSKHLQMKYGVDKQNKPYGKAGGELMLTAEASTSPVYDFTGYPILPGDIDQNGVINATDFSETKTKGATHKTVTENETDAKYDLDGNCQLSMLDVGLLVNSLDEKQEEIY